MTEGNSAEDRLKKEQEVAAYLEQHPEFFENHQEILEKLRLQHKVYGSVSLVERQILGLRNKAEKLQTQLNSLIDNAHNNGELLNKCAELFVAMIAAHSTQEMVDRLLEHLRDNFELDNVQLWLCDDAGTLHHVNYSDIEIIRQLTDQHFIQNDPVCGRVTESISQLFGGDHELESYSMIPLGENASIGVIALGSKDVDLFTADMGTLFLRLIGDVTEACLAKQES